MQIGEPVAVVPAVTPPPDAELAAELVSITFKSGIKVSRGPVTVEGPHWEKGKEGAFEDIWSRLARLLHLPVEPYSKRPAVFVAGGLGGPYDVEVTLKITKSKNVSGDAHLVGAFSGISIEGTCPSSAGDHIVRARITNPPEELRACRGRIAWRLDAEATPISVGLGATFVEVYFILGEPSPPYRENGVWAEALRFLFGHVGVTGSNRWTVIATITTYCHSGHGLRYETHHGRARFGVNHNGGVFALGSYLVRRKGVCNCYDQAAAVQALAGAIGVSCAWLFLQPFGYIRPTNLVGVGLCNNPFFEDNEKLKLVPPDSEERTAFGNHAFLATYGAMALDGCAKPHLATETIPEYLADSIDDTPSLYDRRFQPGRPRDVLPKIGVVGVK